MENQLQKQEKTLVTYLAQGITVNKKGEWEINTKEVDRYAISTMLKKFKFTDRDLNYGELVKIPEESRIPAMASKDMRGTVTTIAVALTLALESINLKNSMNAVQIVDCAEAIIDGAADDKISFEDLLLFLQKLTRGQYGSLYESIDQLKILSLFDKYRNERFDEMVKLRNKRDEEYKQMGDMNIYERENPKDASTLGMQLDHYRQKAQARSDEMKERKNRRR